MGSKQGDRTPLGGGLQELVAIEWELIEKLRALADSASEDKHRVQYYLSLSSHARTLAFLIGQCGGGESGEDLAKLLQQISKKAKKFVRVMNRESRGAEKT